MKTRFHFLLPLIVVAATTWDQRSVAQETSEAPGRSLALSLVESPLYVGEMPVVRLEFKAGATLETVVRPESALLTGALSFDLLREDGSRVPGGSPHDGNRVPTVADYMQLAPGKTVKFEEPILSRFPSAGRYRVKARLTPFPGLTDEVIERELKVSCHEIMSSMVVDRCIVQRMGEIPRPFQDREWELMNVASHNKNVLMFRETHHQYGVQILKRLMPCEATTRITAVIVSKPNQSEVWAETWFTCNIGRELILGRVDSVTGRLLETRKLTPVPSAK